MQYNEALEYIHSLLRFGSRPGLERIRELLEKLDNPQNSLKFIHIAGTNGKGSVSVMLSNTFIAAGYNTGLYISPYVDCFRERIQVNGTYIPEEDLARLTEKVKNTGITVTEFEFITAVAFLYYKECGCDIVVLETGLGGRLDATNVINNPIASVITGIGLDHTAILGDTVEKIAAEKCGIIKSSPVFTTYNQPPEALKVIKSYNNVTVTNVNELAKLQSDISGNTFIYKGNEYRTSLAGEHQMENAILVIDTALGCNMGITVENIKYALSHTEFCGRLEVICKNPLVVIDGAHNVHGAAALCNQLKKHGKVTLITGMMADKDCNDVISLIAPYCKKIITVTVEENSRSISAEELSDIASLYCKDVTAAKNYGEALEMSRGEKEVFIVGSLYLASAIRTLAKKFYNNN